MLKITVLFFLCLTEGVVGQSLIGKTEGASIFLEDNRYEVIFQNGEGKYSSIYIVKGEMGQDGLSAISKHVKLLFDKQKGEYLLQFEDDSMLLIYEKGVVFMEIWHKHDSDNRTRSKGFSLKQFQELFGD